MYRDMRGFSLIELMVVVAIIAILAAIALPAYNNYRARTADNACLSEMKAYANVSIALLRNGDTAGAAPARACGAADNATALTGNITGTPRTPGTRQTQCNMATGACALL